MGEARRFRHASLDTDVLQSRRRQPRTKSARSRKIPVPELPPGVALQSAPPLMPPAVGGPSLSR